MTAGLAIDTLVIDISMVNEARLFTIDEEPVPVVTVRLERLFYHDGDREDNELRKTYDKTAIREVILAILNHNDVVKLLPIDETNNNLYHRKVKLGSGTRLSFVFKLQTSLTFGDLKNVKSIRAALSKWECSMYHHRLNVNHGLDARLIFNLFGIHPFHVNKIVLETKIDQTIKTYVNEKSSESQKKTWGPTFCKWIKETSDTVVEIGVRNWTIDHKEADQKRLRFPVKVLTMRVEGRFVTQMRNAVSVIEWKRKMLGILVDEFSDDYTPESLEKLAYSHHQFIQESAYIHLSWMPEGLWNIRLPEDQNKTVEELLFDATITVGGIKKRLFRSINKIKESTGLYYLTTKKTLLRDAETFAMQLMEKVNATKEFQEDKSLDNPEGHCIIVGRKTEWDKERALLQRKQNSVNMTAVQMNHRKRTSNKVSADRTVSEPVVAARSDDTVITNDKSVVVPETETLDVEPTPAVTDEIRRAPTSNDSTDQETSTEAKLVNAGGKDDTTHVEATKATEMQPESCNDSSIPPISDAELAVEAPSSTPFATLFEDMMPGLKTHFEEIKAQLQLMKDDYKNVRVQKQRMKEENENVRAQNKHLKEECEERRARHLQLLLLGNERTKLLKEFGVYLPSHLIEKDNSIMINDLLFMVQSLEAQNKRLEGEHDIIKRERDELVFIVNEQTKLLKQNGVKASLAWIDKTISLTWMEQYNSKNSTETDKASGTQIPTPKSEQDVEPTQAKAVQATSRPGSATPSKLKKDSSVMIDEVLRRVQCLEAQNQLLEDEHARIRSQHDQILVLLNEQTRILEYKMKPTHQESTRVPSPPTILRHSHGPPIVGCPVKSTTDTIATKNQ